MFVEDGASSFSEAIRSSRAIIESSLKEIKVILLLLQAIHQKEKLLMHLI